MSTRKRYPEKYKEFVQYDTFEGNPFAENITGLGTAYINEQKVIIDRRQYAKVYLDFLDIIIQKGMTLPAIKMLFFILKKMHKGSDVVQFTIAAAKAHTGYKADKSIYEGLVELIRMGVIARKEGSEEQYFINPQYIFRGKRDGLLNEPEDGAEVIG